METAVSERWDSRSSFGRLSKCQENTDNQNHIFEGLKRIW